MKYTMKLNLLLASFLAGIFLTQAQDFPQQDLDSVVIISSRIELPFKENSRTITVINSEMIQKSAATNVVDLLQQVAGVDIRRRGTAGSQADLYIRGGSFDQTLLLIDGIKLEDAQTGHHTMNLILPLDVIERIEIIKGPAARVFGQNAFTGAVNIVTKKALDNQVKLGVQGGSFGQKNAEVTVSSNLQNTSHLVHYSRNTSEGYRYNTDYDNQNYFIKSSFNKNHMPIDLIATFQERKFGANGFYSTPSATDQYEETQASLVGLSSVYKHNNLTLKPRLYWRRNQDEYVFIRSNPEVYRNLHITNKVAAELHGSYSSSLGTTGFGVDLAQVYLSSNNLGDRERFMTNFFLEHRFKFLNDKLDVTPGVALTYFSDFKFHAFPGVDIGYSLSEQFKFYGNVGYTYRIPTYTDLYYSDPTTLGNDQLDPEEAIAEEIGIKYLGAKWNGSLAFFNRDSKKLIDYVKENEDDLWQATNIRDLNTKGFEANINYRFDIAGATQLMDLGYTFIDDEVKDLDIAFSRYSINSLKHQVTATYKGRFFNILQPTIVYKYAERTSGQAYTVYDAGLSVIINQLELSVFANNIFNEEYYETNLVPMPKGNLLFGLNYRFK
ncbi:TonB-dependent receptor [Mangrovimonas sp. AS39]|uniref:TonB-dependent receptor plug domain-containing protein n=1 Tax=Mangrovimonas futianensis TaxID=2895523 RepID=UPI001E35BE80|nr:TonB-dependent receptor [Mangrovimonas futianensis]MCF1190519.1 TonB-dependent receptor [Mangrovimonas futianensis]MCF1193729.1 TonB-dependent receptor [Mangrovimonas futianensis]